MKTEKSDSLETVVHHILISLLAIYLFIYVADEAVNLLQTQLSAFIWELSCSSSRSSDISRSVQDISKMFLRITKIKVSCPEQKCSPPSPPLLRCQEMQETEQEKVTSHTPAGRAREIEKPKPHFLKLPHLVKDPGPCRTVWEQENPSRVFRGKTRPDLIPFHSETRGHVDKRGTVGVVNIFKVRS